MHVSGYPHYYIKGDRRRPVYHTGEVRDLVAMGWVKEGTSSPIPEPVPAPQPAPEPVAEAEAEASEPEVEVSEAPAFDLMTRAELLAYALERGVDLPNNALKAELIEACKGI